VIPQKHFTHDYKNEYKNLQRITFVQETAAVLSNMVSQSKQTHQCNIFPTVGIRIIVCTSSTWATIIIRFDATSLSGAINFMQLFLPRGNT